MFRFIKRLKQKRRIKRWIKDNKSLYIKVKKGDEFMEVCEMLNKKPNITIELISLDFIANKTPVYISVGYVQFVNENLFKNHYKNKKYISYKKFKQTFNI
ncbi:MAG TPA: hypothetical protein PLP73_00925 [Candidatus Absconditabacterales bacterium]|nr:hypothetical protein [Candidatus Absconditabacterales bacterium]HRU50151.1 hypothetical protein [Candidatus Absconditabacterales bacterium]